MGGNYFQRIGGIPGIGGKQQVSSAELPPIPPIPVIPWKKIISNSPHNPSAGTY